MQSARRSILHGSEALKNLAESLDASFARAVEMILDAGGRLIVSGIGKSAHIAQKIVATMNSTGTPAVFMHAADATHGDLGIIQKGDVVMIISKSGNTPEIKLLASLIAQMNIPLIGMTADKESHLAKQADIVLHTPLDREACPFNLAPTTSTLLQMAMGDALAIAILEQRHFTPEDFARYHPGGTLGKRLLLTVDKIIRGRDIPQVSPDTPVKDVIMEITAKRVGGTAVLDRGNIAGIITDGDIRRMLQKHTDISGIKAHHIMSPRPKTVRQDTLAADALKKMKAHNINQLIVTDEQGRYKGIIHLHDILKEGIL